MSIHTLRQSYATHLLEAGLNIRFIERALGTLTCSCDEDGQVFDIYRSCGNRHYPVAGKAKGRKWLAKQLDRLLPVPHFMITFTVSAAFRSLFLAHRKLSYQAFFQASSAVPPACASQGLHEDPLLRLSPPLFKHPI